MLVAARDAKVKRFVYAASSSTYGDSKILPKVEEVIGRPLSPCAITIPNFSEKMVRIILSYTDYVKRTVWNEQTTATDNLPR